MKVVRVGKTDVGNVFCKIEVKPKEPGKLVLSITGVEAPKRNGDASCCGQIADTLKQVLEFAPGWDKAMRDRFAEVWDRWHLNDTRPGCEHQRAEKWDERPIYPDQPTNTYVKHPDGNSGWNMLVWLPVTKGGLLSAPCPICGYKYGSQWLYEPIPDDVISFLQGLPDTDINPPWV